MEPAAIPEIETQRLMLRRATVDHLDVWAAKVFGDPEVMRYLPKRDMTPYARAERALNNYNRLWASHQLGGWVITEKSTGQFVGHCHISYLDETNEFELGYCLSRAFWGKGIATEAARAATRYAFESRGLEQMMALTLPDNKASQKVLEHIGFVYVKAAHYYDLDVAYFALSRGQFQDDGSPYQVHVSAG